MSKRTLMKGMAAAVAVGVGDAAAAVAEAPFFAAHRLQIGIQLYALRVDMRADFAGTLRKVAAIGYRLVETSSQYGHSVADFRMALDAAGLACRSIHAMPQPLGQGPDLTTNFDQVVAEAHTIGATGVVMPLFLIPERLRSAPNSNPGNIIGSAGKALTADDYLRMADFLNAKGEALRKHGLQLSYHNHNVEFAPQGTSFGLEILLRKTSPRLVQFELDVGWAYAARADVFALLAAHPGRFTKFHIKDIKPTTPLNFAFKQDPADLGNGVIDWKRLLPAAYAAGTRGFYVEQEDPFTRPPIEVMADNYHYLANLKTRR
jgi:sugar phosphate isomerase/epimerase